VASLGVSADSPSAYGSGGSPSGLNVDLGFDFDDVHKLRELARESSYDLRDQAIKDIKTVRDHIQQDVATVRDRLVTYCSITFIARGDVAVSNGASSYTGTIESVLLWDHAPGQYLPRFVLTSAPLNGRPAPETASLVNLTSLRDTLMDIGNYAVQCNGPEQDNVPMIDPGSIKLSLIA